MYQALLRALKNSVVFVEASAQAGFELGLDRNLGLGFSYARFSQGGGVIGISGTWNLKNISIFLGIF